MANSATALTDTPVKFFNSDIATLRKIVVVRDTAADITLLAAAAGKRCGLFGAQYAIGTDHDLTFKSGATTLTVFGAIRGLNNVIQPTPVVETEVNKDLIVSFSQNITAAIFWVQYFTYLSRR